MPKVLSFLVFVTVAVVVYGILNYYFLKKHNAHIKTGQVASILLRLVLATLILAPVATMIFSMNGAPFLAAITGFTGYSWLAFLFLFLVIHGTADIILFILEKAGYTPSKKTPRVIFIVTLAVNIVIMVYGYHEAHDIRTEVVELQTDKLPPRHRGLIIVQLSDIHFSPIISVETARKICRITRRARPDLIVSTGDLLDRGIRNPKEISRILRSLEARLGKLAVTGNHEFYAGIDLSKRFTSSAGFTLLRNRVVNAGSYLSVAGVDDPARTQYSKQEKSIPEKQVLATADTKRFRILLKHQPRIEEESLDHFELQLSGHTHGGQIFPFTLLVRIPFRFICGLYRLNNNTHLYVSRGTGTWGPPIRFLAPPEITIIKLKAVPRVKR